MDDDIETRLKKVIVELLPVDEAKVIPESAFENDLGADSLDMVELLMVAEEEFDCEITDEEAEKIRTVQDGIDLIKRKKGIAE